MAFTSPVNFSRGQYGFGWGGGYSTPSSFGGYGVPSSFGGSSIPSSFGGGYGVPSSFGSLPGMYEFGSNNPPGAIPFGSIGNYGGSNDFLGNFTGSMGNNSLGSAYGLLDGSGLLQGAGLGSLSPATLGTNSLGLMEFT